MIGEENAIIGGKIMPENIKISKKKWICLIKLC
jgi:hypothetical protein